MSAIEANHARTVMLCWLALFGTIALGLIVARWITRLNRSSQQITQNQLDQEVPIQRIRGTRELSQSFQFMAKQLQSSFQLQTNGDQELKRPVTVQIAGLAQARDLREAIFNESTDAIFLVEPAPSLQILDCNQRAVELFGVDSKAELVGIRGAALRKRPCTQAELDEIAEEFDRKGFWSQEIEYVTKKGKTFWGNLAAKPITVAGQALQLVRLTDISDRKQLELALQHSETNTKAILNSAIAGITSMRVFADYTWEIDQVSAGVEIISGYTPQQLIQDKYFWTSQIVREDWEAMVSHVFHDIFHEQSGTYEYRLHRKDGNLCWISQTHNSFWNEAQHCWNVTLISVDITQRKQAEAALRESEERWQLAIAGTNDGIWDHNLITNELFLSPRCEEMLECRLEELNPFDRWVERVHPDDLAILQNKLQQYLKREIPQYVSEYRMRCKDGSYKWILARGKAIWNEQGIAVRMIGSVSDISDRKQVELALRQSEQKFKGAFDTITTGMALVSLMGRFQEVNTALCQMLGYSPAELLAMKLEDVVNPIDHHIELAQAERMMAGEIPGYQVEKRFLHKDGHSIWGLLNVALMRDADGQVLYLIAHIVDISDRHKLDELKDEFISVVSHELRTPLTSIRGSLGVLETGALKEDPDTAQQMLQLALRSTERLVRLVNDILNLERLESDKMKMVLEPCKVDDLMQQAVDSVQAIADKEGILISILPISAVVQVDPDAIVQVFTNLLGNAIKFSSAGGRILVKAEIENREKRNSSTLHSLLPTPYILFSIHDEGRGIPADKLEAIFGRFQQVDATDSRQKGGTGLGLAICKSIVQKHNGRIWAESEVSKGSTFYFTIPLES